jgi:two-component system nitrogen regulation sensor histidine kinase NtrY
LLRNVDPLVKPADPPTGPAPKRSNPLAPAEQRRRRREWRIATVVALGLALLAAFEQQVVAFSRSLPIGSDIVFLALVNVNVIGMGLLVFLVGRNLVKLVVERRRGVIGSRLNTKFVISFVFAAGLSTSVLFLLSAFLVTHAVNTWFELEVSRGLEEAVSVADAYYEEAEDRALRASHRIARQIEDMKLMNEDSLADLAGFVASKQLEYDLGVVEVFSAQHEKLASATHPEIPVVALEAPESDLIRKGLSGVESTVVEDVGSGELIRAVVPVRSTFQRADIVGVVVVNRFLPRTMGQRVDVIRQALHAYRRLEPSEGRFQLSMLLLLGMLTLMSLLFSSWMGFRLAKQITDPIQRLAHAADEVAAGNLEVRIEQRGDDEIGSLVASFNRMASDLEASRSDLERRRAQMEIVLRSVAAGVISLDRDAIVTTINPSALRLLGIAPGAWVGQKLSAVLEGRTLAQVEDLLRRLAAGPQSTIRRQLPVTVAEELRTLNWTVSRLRDLDGENAGFVVVIDDVTQILKAQRMAAWRDVARRIAHEIKNPLTPIQLSAQRLRRKLGGRLDDPEAQKLLDQSTEAITNQVDAMKLLLSEFSNFAQLPATDPVPTDLNQLVAETMAMYEGKQGIRFRTELEPDLPRLELDREQIKRVILNLVDNAMGAIEAAEPGPREIEVRTRYDREVGTVHLEVSDTGCGIAPEDRLQIFQPGFSTKSDGSGIGLAIVSRIVSDHSGYIRVRANTPRGSRILIELPVRT